MAKIFCCSGIFGIHACVRSFSGRAQNRYLRLRFINVFQEDSKNENDGKCIFDYEIVRISERQV